MFVLGAIGCLILVQVFVQFGRFRGCRVRGVGAIGFVGLRVQSRTPRWDERDFASRLELVVL